MNDAGKAQIGNLRSAIGAWNIQSLTPTSGFTLFELLAVITIIGIVLAVTLGAFQGWGDAQAVRGSAELVEAALCQARDYAVTHRTAVRFSYETASDETNGIKRISGFSTATYADGQYIGSTPQRLPGGVWLVQTVPIQQIQDTYGSFVFRPSGRAENVETNQPLHLFVISRKLRKDMQTPNVAYQLDINPENSTVSVRKLSVLELSP